MGAPHGTPEQRFWRHVDRTTTPDGCHTWTGSKDPKGYGRINIDRIPVLAHRLAWCVATGVAALDSSVFVCHSCDNPSCVRFEHLWLGSAADNNRDCLAKGRHAAPKITPQQAKEIRAAYATGCVSQQQLGDIYGLSQGGVSKIVLGKVWKAAA